MEPLENPTGSLWLAAALGLVFVACFAAWGLIGARLVSGRPVLRFERRRPAPWGALDMVIILVGYFVLNLAAYEFAMYCLPDELQQPLAANGDTAHPVVRIVLEGNAALIALAGFVAIIVAPLSEEFIFRLVLQGGLERSAMRSAQPAARTASLTAALLLPAMLFALLHFREAGAARTWQYYAAMLTARAVADLLLVGLGIVWLRVIRGATLRDLGVVRLRFDRDVAVGVVAISAFIVPAYAMQYALTALLPASIAPDPAAIFLLAIVWGFLYQRTHRIVPSLVSHVLLNALSFALALAAK